MGAPAYESLEAPAVKGSRAAAPDPPVDPGNVDAQELSTNQEAIVVPLIMGEQRLPLIWISSIYNQYTVPAPVDRPGKK